MLENDSVKEPPKMVINFKQENQSDEERQKEKDELLRKRNELLISMGYSIPTEEEMEKDNLDDDYLDIIK